MLRVLQIVDNMNAGGIQSFIMNVYRNIDRDSIQFDFLLCKEKPLYGSEISELGGKIFYIPARSKGILSNIQALNKFFEMHQDYKVVHMHESSLSYIEPLIVARKYGISKRIIHSHSTHIGGSRIHKYLHLFNSKRIDRIATHFVGCGEAAADWMFGKSKIREKVEIIYNGIDVNKYIYNDSIRHQIRQHLNIEQQFVIGHAGRFEAVKNHRFILETFKEVLKREPNSVLLLAGDGRLLSEIKEYADKLNILSKTRFLGVRNDLDVIYQGLDCFLLPSLYEGFPVSIIEAESSGLPCVVSDTISKEVKQNTNIIFESLNNGPNIWAERILNNRKRINGLPISFIENFDISSTINKLTDLYAR